MNRLTKLLILVVSMIGIVQSVWFIGLVIPIDYLSKMVLQTVQTNVDWIMILALVGSVIVGFVAIMAIITILVAPRKADKIVFRSANGRLSISKKAVEKSLEEAIMQQAAVSDVQTTVKLHTKNRIVKVRITAVDKQGRDLVELGEKIQTIVAAKMTDLMNVKVKKVRVKVNPFDTVQNKKRANHPRVV